MECTTSLGRPKMLALKEDSYRRPGELRTRWVCTREQLRCGESLDLHEEARRLSLTPVSVRGSEHLHYILTLTSVEREGRVQLGGVVTPMGPK
jgi:hypothetical protein